MTILISVFAFLILFTIVVSVHEGAHFWAARMCGMKVLEFSLGMGPVFYKKTFKSGTLFTLRYFPVGGFVKPLDETAVTKEEWAATPEEEKSLSFSRAPRYQRAFMVAAGPISNFVLAFFILFFSALLIGEKDLPPVVGQVIPGSIAENAGIESGDIIRLVNGVRINRMSEYITALTSAAKTGSTITIRTDRLEDVTASMDPSMSSEMSQSAMGFYPRLSYGPGVLTSVNKGGIADALGLQAGDVIKRVGGVEIDDTTLISKTVRSLQGTSFDITLERNGSDQVVRVDLPENTFLGVTVKPLRDDYFISFKPGFAKSVDYALTMVSTITERMFDWLIGVFQGQLKLEDLGGPVTIADVSGQAMQSGFQNYILIVAAISISLGFMNLLPVPLLDGGHLLTYAIEGVIGRDIPENIQKNMSYVGIFFIFSIMGLSVFTDIDRYLLKYF